MKTAFILTSTLLLASAALASEGAKAPPAKPTTPATPSAPAVAGKSIVQSAVENGNFKTLCSLLATANLVDTLNGPGPFTVFAPTDAAFAKVSPETLASLQKDPKALAAILTYHVVPGNVASAEVVKLKEVKTVQGQPIAITVKEGKVMLNDGATVTAVDVKASNGVIHVIDTVILPPAKATTAAPSGTSSGK
jgi:uncharacterized surface protein with fasciclin (FAS1) repeats